MKKLVMELGGHAPVIVFKGADLDHAVAETMKAKFATSGQDCLGANRIYVERPIYEEFCRKFTEATEALTLGRGMDDPDIGPLMNEKAVEKQEEHVADALAKGARLASGGKRHALGPLFYRRPPCSRMCRTRRRSCARKPSARSRRSRRSTPRTRSSRGPTTPNTGWSPMCTATTRAASTGWPRALQFGMVAVNRTKVTGAPIPFGGTKQSGLGREGARLGMEEFIEIKYVCRDWA